MTVIDNASSGLSNSDIGDELSSLFERRALLLHDVAVHRAMGDLENNDPYHRALEALLTTDRRISDVRSAMGENTCSAVEDDGTIQIGSVATVQFGHDKDDVETFTLVDTGRLADSNIETCSVRSPLGSALLGSRTGDERTYELPTGATCTVRVLEVAPRS